MIAIGSDHGGFALKQEIMAHLKARGLEYKDYGYWNVPYFQQKAAQIGPETRLLIDRVIARFAYPVQAFRSCFGILRFAERYSCEALEACSHDAILAGRCNYSYVANTIATYDRKPDREQCSSPSGNSRRESRKPVTGAYKDDDAKYTLENLLKKQSQEAHHE